MKLKAYKNLYAYYIHTDLIQGREISLQYSRASKKYNVIMLEKYSPVLSRHFTSAFDAKKFFRSLIKA